MPKKQSTASKRARAAQRTDPDTTFAGGQAAAEQLAARAYAERHGLDPDLLAVHTAALDEAGHLTVTVEGLDQQPNDPSTRWGVATPTPIGWHIRQVPYQHDIRAAVRAGTRLPVAHRGPDGRMRTSLLHPAVAWPSGARDWGWVETGWSVGRPGTFLPGADPISPSPDLPYEVRTLNISGGPYEDGAAQAPSWYTKAWCASLDHARQVAVAYTAHHLNRPKRAGGGTVQARIIQHSKGHPPLTTLVETFDADPARPTLRHAAPFLHRPGRPADSTHSTEPRWRGADHGQRLDYELRVWDTEANVWATLAWLPGGLGEAGILSALLGVGTDGRYPWAETWGPRFPGKGDHDWTREGRQLVNWHPDLSRRESDARHTAERAAREQALHQALAGRSAGRLTPAQVADLLADGGEDYRSKLRVGQVRVLNVLNRRRLGLPEGPERTAVRAAIDALEERHHVEEADAAQAWAEADTDPELLRFPSSATYVRCSMTAYLGASPASVTS
ncbi:hypothetical protein ABT095_14380 [Kitasatospora sp. NPDC002227]|uniref:hypothetical protein n=1 Tax=Kitasatospora sp. NPDC002227 TaxID=3154773 RepID=UPI00332DAC3A